MGHEGHDHHSHAHSHGSVSVHQHKHQAPTTVSVFVATCSDSRNHSSDESGKLLVELLQGHGHSVVGTALLPDEPAEIQRVVSEAENLGARAVLFTGGTGIGRRDHSVETLSKLFDKELPGFGELFRYLSFKEIGSAAMMSKATAGTLRGMVVFALPGSPHAVKLAMNALILPELGHLARELSR